MNERAGAGLEEFFNEFNADLADCIENVTGVRPSLKYAVLTRAREQAISVRLAQQEETPGIIKLKSRRRAIIGVQLHYQYTWDSAQKFPAVSKSSFTVHPYADPTAWSALGF